MILGIGSDIVDIRRIEKLFLRFGSRFESRVFRLSEIARADIKGRSGERARFSSLAKRFAAKEACAKALGTGIGRISWHDMLVSNLPSGAPCLTLSGNAEAVLKGLTPEGSAARIHLSLADDYPVAQAFVIISAEK
jgi:holo-[acyl-carrier protein] synthase